MSFEKVEIYSTIENYKRETSTVKDVAYINKENINYVLIFGDRARICFAQGDYLEISTQEWLEIINGRQN